MTVLLVVLAGLVALGLAFLFFWAFWRANHLDNNVMFFKWLGCEIKRGGRHRGARHPMGGYRCLDCFLGGDLEDMGMGGDGYVDPRRRTYTAQRGAPAIEPVVTMAEAERARQRATLEAREQQRAAWRAAPPTSSATPPRPAATLRPPRSTTTEERIGQEVRKQRAEDTLASMYHHQAAALTSLIDTAPAPAAPSTPDFSDVSSGHSSSGDFGGGGGDFGGGGASGEF